MPHRSRTSGADLIPSIEGILGDIGAFSERRRAETKQTELEQLLLDEQGQGGIAQAPKATSLAGGALNILGQLAPQLAQALGQANPQQAAQLRQEAEQGVTLATELQKLPDHGARIQRLAVEAGRIASEGGDMDRLVELSNMDPARMDIELQKMQMIGEAVTESVPSRGASIAAITARNPALGTQIQGRRDRLAREEQARRNAAASRAAADRAPKGAFAKGKAEIAGNLARGDIDQDEADARMVRLNAAELAPPAPGKPNIQEIFDTETGLKKKVIVNNDGSFTPLGGTQAPAAGPDTFRLATPEEAAANGAPFGQINEATGFFHAAPPTPPGFSLSIGDDGAISFVQGPGVGGASIVDPTGASRRAPKDFELFQDPDTGELRQRVIRGSATSDQIIEDSNKSHRALKNYQAANANVERKIDRAIEIIETSDIPVTGIGGWLTRGLAGSPAFELNTLVGPEGTITTNEAFDLLRQIKTESKTGGAVGQLSDSERVAMGGIHTSLDQRLSKKALLQNLMDLRDFRTASMQRFEDAYATDFSDIAAQFGAPSGVMSADEIIRGDDISGITGGDFAFMSDEAMIAYTEAKKAQGQ